MDRIFIDPMCGSDGVTYSNYCEMEKIKCDYKPDLFIIHNGKCSGMY